MSSFFDEFVDNEPAPTASFNGEGDGPLLAVDFGSTMTRAMLVESIGGMYRFVAFGEAPSTHTKPWDNLLNGLSAALKPITVTTTRALTDNGNQLIIPERDTYVGVERFVATMSGGHAITAMIVGLIPQVSIQSMTRALNAIYVNVVDTYSLVDPRGPEEFFTQVITNRPDLIAITGGTNGGTVNALRKRIDLVAAACASLQPEARPMILYAGNQEQTDYVTGVFEEIGVALVVAHNPRPELNREDLTRLTQDLTKLFNNHHLQHTAGYRSLEKWSGGQLMPSSQGFSQLIQVLGHLDEENVLGIDIGGRATTITAVVGGDIETHTYTDLGVGIAARRALECVSPRSVLRWAIHPDITAERIQQTYWNRALYPSTIPVTEPERDMEYAFVREILREAFERFTPNLPKGDLPNFNTIVLSGSVLTRAPSAALAVMTLTDILGPNGYTRILGDPYGIAPVMGLLSTVDPRIFVQVLDTGAFVEMASLFGAHGRSREGQTVVEGSLSVSEGEDIPITAKGNAITLVPFGRGLEGTVTLQTSGVRLDMPKEGGQHRQAVVGSEAGLFIDTRVTPITPPRDDSARRKRLKEWTEAVYQFKEAENTP